MADATTIGGFMARRERAREQAVRARVEEAQGALPALASLLATRFRARRVWLFGSLAWGTPHERSDIDLAAEGVDPGVYLAALVALDEASPVPVQLVRIEEAPPALRERILESGRLLHDGA
jgi:predicted nucleotidyltransferase